MFSKVSFDMYPVFGSNEAVLKVLISLLMMLANINKLSLSAYRFNSAWSFHWLETLF